MLRVGIWVESFSCAGILLLQWQGENIAHRQHLKFCHFQPVQCASKNPISPKVFNRFSNSLPQLEDVEGGHLGGKFQVRRYFTFAMARWKLCASTTFEILPLSTCTVCEQKSCISNGIQPIFENFASARRCWRWAFEWKVSGAQVFYFCNGEAKTLRIDNIWNFATFNLYSVPAKILYLQRYSTDFPNLWLSSTMLKVGIWVESFRWAGILLLQWRGENIAHRQHLKFCHFQPVHCASKNPISPKVFSRFSKSLPQREDLERGHLGGMFQVRRYFTFAMARWKLCASTTFEILPLSTCTLSQQKSYISKGIQPIFEFFASARRCFGWAFWWKVSCAPVVYCCNGKAKTLRIDNIWNFATFNLFTVTAKIPYLQRYSTDFRNLCLSSNDVEGGHLGGKFQLRRYFTFAMARWKLCASTTFEILPLSTCTVCQQKSCISKGIQPIFEILCLSSKMLRVGIWVESVSCAGILVLQWRGENFAHRQHLKFCHFQPVQCASKNPVFPMVFNRFSKILLQLEDVEGGHLSGKFHVRRYFTFAMARRKLCASTTFETLPLSTCTVCQQNSYISKGIQPIFEIFASARRCWRWEFEWKVSGEQGFYFWNGEVKTLRIDNIWNFATFNLYTVPSKILYLQRYSADFRNLCLSAKILRGGIWVECFRCAGILLLQWQGENFAHRQHLKFCHFQPVHCPSKNHISPKVFNRFSNSLPQLEDVLGGHFGGKFHVRR